MRFKYRDNVLIPKDYFATIHTNGVDRTGEKTLLKFELNNRIKNAIQLLLILAATSLFCISAAFAQATKLEPQASDTLDAVLLLDASGSMRLTDPERLRDEGANLFIQFLKPGDQIGIIEFEKGAKLIRPLSNYDREQGDKLTKEVSSVGNSGQYTDLLEGIKAAAELLETQGRPDANRAIILLSDGKMDPHPSRGLPDARSLELKNTILPRLKEAGIKIHTLAFSDQVDKALLQEIAEETEGVSWYTPDPDTIHKSYADLFLVVKKPQVLPLTSKGFKIDGDVQEATFYINRGTGEEVAIIRPDGTQINPEIDEDIKWYRGSKFDVITALNPEVGNWQVLGLPKNEGYATVLTNLKLITDWPSSVYEGDTTILQARLYDNDKPVQLPEMTESIKYAFQVTPTDKISEPIIRDLLKDDGDKKHSGDRIARDGIYSGRIKLDFSGEYKLKVVASGPTFERYQHIPFRVKPRLISVSVVSVEPAAGHDHEHGDEGPQDYLRVTLSNETASFKNVEVTLYATNEEGKKYRVPIERAREGLKYEAPASVFREDGTYKLQATLKAKKGKNVKTAESLIHKYERHTAAHAHGDEEEEGDMLAVVEDKKAEHLKKKKAEKPESPWIYVLLIVLINVGMGVFGIVSIGKSQGKAEDNEVNLISIEPVEAAIATLKERSEKTEVDFDDPMFSAENLAKAKAALGGDSAATEDADSTDTEAVESEPAAEGEAEATAEEGAAEEAPAEDGGEASGEEPAEEESTEEGAGEEAAEEAPAEEATEEAPAEDGAEEEENKE